MQIMTPLEARPFILEEFGDVKLGNGKRRRRLLSMAERLAQRASGKVTEAFENSAERQGAYKFFENDAIEAAAIGRSSYLACARRCAGNSYVYICADGSSLAINDESGGKKLGPIGPRRGGCGVEVMSAIAIHANGTPVGICGQSYWTRDKGQRLKKTRHLRTLEQKETRHWMEVIAQTEEAFAQEGGQCQRWYQCDRGADFREMLAWAQTTRALVTVRSAQNRIVCDNESRRLWDILLRQSSLGKFNLEITGRPKRKARIACIEVRASKVSILLKDKQAKSQSSVVLTAVLAREEGTVPEGEKPIEWLLLTNYPAANFEDARKVIFGYSQRWRIEEFHKSWKSVCGVEKIQLREYENIIKMATLLAAIAIRVERLKYLARTAPELPANTELNQSEIDALIILRKPKSYKRGQVPTIGEAVRWIADLGGFTGKSSGGPPGSIVIGRGLLRLREASAVVEALR
jgi:hypothetical protein